MAIPPLKLPQLRRDQYEIAVHPAPRRAVVAGRRWGKTVAAGATGVTAAYGGLPVALVAPEYRNLDPLWDFALEAALPLKAKGYARISEADRSIDFLFNGGKLELFSAKNHIAALGRDFALIIFDEAAQIDENVVNGTFIPMLADWRGDALAISTPRGFNWFHNWYMMGQSGDPYYKSWKRITLDNPSPNIQAAYHDAKQQLPTRIFEQEWNAEFLDDGLSVFVNIDRCATAEKQEKAIEGHRYAAGMDVGRSNDFTALVVYDMTIHEAVYLLRLSDMDFTRQETYIRDAYNRFKWSVLLCEQNSIGLPLLDQLRHVGLKAQGWQTTQATKAEMVDTLSLEFQNQSIKIIPDPVLISELKIFSGERTANGMMRYAAAGTGHDDTVIALGLSVVAAKEHAPPAWEPFIY